MSRIGSSRQSNRSAWKVLLLSCLLIPIAQILSPETTIVDPDKYSWGGNIGWINWEADGANGAALNGVIMHGFIYSANVGWINLGDGAPAGGGAYSNASAQDFGVNVDAATSPDFYLLSGYAWSANAGWINFDVAAQTGDENRPRISKTTGVFEGFAWGANLGWLSLNSEPIAILRTRVEPPDAAARDWRQYD